MTDRPGEPKASGAKCFLFAQDGANNLSAALTGMALRYPQRTSFLGQVFNDTTNSYKLVWFLAFLSLLARSGERTMKLSDLFTEMVVVSWHPVCLFRLSLGRQDKLQNVILEIQQMSGLVSNAAPEIVRRFVDGSSDAQARLDAFKRYVPTRFLSPWFDEELRGTSDARKDAKIKGLAHASQTSSLASLYHFQSSGTREAIEINESWKEFLLENFSIAQSFAEHHFALYLQARNPNVPGVVNKLHAPAARRLSAARNFWRLVRHEFHIEGKSIEFRDIYSGKELSEDFSIDHFLPWSFVVHDLLWNLVPVELATNSSKNDRLPDLDLYLPRLAKLHFAAILAASRRPQLLDDYADCFKRDTVELLSLAESDFVAKYREIIVPQAQIAKSQGFQSGWKVGD